MNIRSTPFIRKDYWSNYNDINQLNQRINEAENEISLVNARLTNDIENVSNNLNTYKNEIADTAISNNIIANTLNANYAKGHYANFDNIFTNNAYIENLTANNIYMDFKTILGAILVNATVENMAGTIEASTITDSTLVNASVENMHGTLHNSTITDSTLVNATIDGNGIFGEATINTANIINLYIDKSTAPVSSSAVLGYDADGKVIPVKSFPESADYLYTDEHGTAFAGVASEEVISSGSLITSYAVKNSLDIVNDSFNNVNDSLNNMNDSFSNRLNGIDNSFNDVNNNFANIGNSFNGINNYVNNGFNEVNNYINNCINNVSPGFTDMASLLNIMNTLIPASFSNANKYTLGDLGFSNVQRIEFVTPADTTGTNISTGPSNPVYLKFDATTNTLKYTSNALVINETMFRAFNADMGFMFSNCAQFNQNIFIPDGVTNMSDTFSNCLALNQNIQLPNSINYSAWGVFYNCQSLNQNILIPNSIKSMVSFFNNCRSLDQNILIPDGAINIAYMFSECDVFNQNILIPNSVKGMGNTFRWCANLNQNILIPNGVEMLDGTFSQCARLNQNILIPPSVKCIRGLFAFSFAMNQDIYIYSQNIKAGRDTGMANAFLSTNIGNIHLPTSVPKDTSNYMYNCLVNGNAGITFPAANIFNDLPVDIDHWPPENV